MRALRILRGIAGTALSFALPWTFVGASLASAVGYYLGIPNHVDFFGTSTGLATAGALLFGVIGAVVGTLFAIAVAVSGRKRAFRDLSSHAFLGLGVAAGLVSGGVLFGSMSAAIGAWPIVFNMGIGIASALGGGTGLALLRLAQRAPDSPSSLTYGHR